MNSHTSNNNSLKNVETELEALAKKSGGQTDRLVSIIEENAKLQAKIKRNLEAQVMQNVLSFTLKSDRDMNFLFDKSEIRRLKVNLSNIPGVTFDKDNFEKKIGDKDLTLADIMAMFRNLKADIPEEENIFHITPQTIVKRGIFGY
jgi:vacuolar-type H+-ATPase subunit D/Vma8